MSRPLRRALAAPAALLAALAGPAPAQERSDEDLRETVRRLEERVRHLEEELRRRPDARAPGESERVESLEEQVREFTKRLEVQEDEARSRLAWAGYMEFQLVDPDVGPRTADFPRFVLNLSYSFTERILFYGEVEIEHSLIEGGEESGEVALEQAYLDFTLDPRWRARAGNVLVPVGILNERHEPTTFYSVRRNQVETRIIPTTWFDAGVGVLGEPLDGIAVRTYVVPPLDASEFDKAGVREGRQSGSRSNLDKVAWVGRVEYRGVPGLTAGTSLFVGEGGFDVHDVDALETLFDVDFRFRHGVFEVRGLYALFVVDDVGALNAAAALRQGRNPNVARKMQGFFIEPAVHVLPAASRQDLVLFGRFERVDTQHVMPRGFIADGSFDQTFWTIGAAFFFTPDVVLKADYQYSTDRSGSTDSPEVFSIGLGWWF
jgi:hypothetical protein